MLTAPSNFPVVSAIMWAVVSWGETDYFMEQILVYNKCAFCHISNTHKHKKFIQKHQLILPNEPYTDLVQCFSLELYLIVILHHSKSSICIGCHEVRPNSSFSEWGIIYILNHSFLLWSWVFMLVSKPSCAISPLASLSCSACIIDGRLHVLSMHLSTCICSPLPTDIH